MPIRIQQVVFGMNEFVWKLARETVKYWVAINGAIYLFIVKIVVTVAVQLVSGALLSDQAAWRRWHHHTVSVAVHWLTVLDTLSHQHASAVAAPSDAGQSTSNHSTSSRSVSTTSDWVVCRLCEFTTAPSPRRLLLIYLCWWNWPRAEKMMMLQRR